MTWNIVQLVEFEAVRGVCLSETLTAQRTAGDLLLGFLFLSQHPLLTPSSSFQSELLCKWHSFACFQRDPRSSGCLGNKNNVDIGKRAQE